MAKTKLVDDGAAYRLLEAIFKRARRDITAPYTKPTDRVEAYEVFRTQAMVEDEYERYQDIPLGARGGKNLGKTIWT